MQNYVSASDLVPVPVPFPDSTGSLPEECTSLSFPPELWNIVPSL